MADRETLGQEAVERRAGRHREPWVRSYCRIRNNGTEYTIGSGAKRMSGGAKRSSPTRDRAPAHSDEKSRSAAGADGGETAASLAGDDTVTK